MGIQIQGNAGVISEVGGTSFRALHTHAKPLEHGALGHYRTTHRCVLATAQVANAPLFTLRNTHATNLIIPTRLTVKLLQIAAGTAQIAGLDIFRATGFTSDYTTGTVTPSPSRRRTNMAAAPGGATVRGVTAAGAANGMTVATIVKDGTPFFQHTYAVTAAAAAANTLQWGPFDVLDDVNGTHPFVLAQNEGIQIENRTLNVTSFGYELTVDLSWAEVAAY